MSSQTLANVIENTHNIDFLYMPMFCVSVDYVLNYSFKDFRNTRKYADKPIVFN